nr:collagen alpha-1(I) chain-like [Oryctolagus cuniculus]
MTSSAKRACRRAPVQSRVVVCLSSVSSYACAVLSWAPVQSRVGLCPPRPVEVCACAIPYRHAPAQSRVGVCQQEAASGESVSAHTGKLRLRAEGCVRGRSEGASPGSQGRPGRGRRRSWEASGPRSGVVGSGEAVAEGRGSGVRGGGGVRASPALGRAPGPPGRAGAGLCPPASSGSGRAATPQEGLRAGTTPPRGASAHLRGGSGRPVSLVLGPGPGRGGRSRLTGRGGAPSLQGACAPILGTEGLAGVGAVPLPVGLRAKQPCDTGRTRPPSVHTRCVSLPRALCRGRRRGRHDPRPRGPALPGETGRRGGETLLWEGPCPRPQPGPAPWRPQAQEPRGGEDLRRGRATLSRGALLQGCAGPGPECRQVSVPPLCRSPPHGTRATPGSWGGDSSPVW